MLMPSQAKKVVVIGTGGTIAGQSQKPQDHVGYRAGALAAADLIAGVPALAGMPLECESLAQMDSCDMDHQTWVRLAQAVLRQLAREDVVGVVITHGTDTLEETAFFLHHTLQLSKPVVLTAAMRPATAPSPDGPQNLLDAVTLTLKPGAVGVLVAFGGQVWAGAEVRKVHGYRVDAFHGGDAGPLAVLQDGQLKPFRPWPLQAPAHAQALQQDPASWPVVDIVTSHAGARGATLDAVVAAGAQGVVLAGTGNGSVHTQLMAAARRAQQQGVVVKRASRCLLGGVVGSAADKLPSAQDATPAQARVLLMLELIQARARLS